MYDQELRFIFLGMPVTFSVGVLKGLLRAGQRPSALLIPESNTAGNPGIRRLQPKPSSSELPMIRPYFQEGIMQLAWEEDLPVFAVWDFSAADTLETLESLQASVGIVACFPMRLPQEILTRPRHGFLNLHPSLLPAYRGPYPLFWTFRDGVQNSGITLHQVDKGLDTGDIMLQKNVFLPDGLGPQEADELFAVEGVGLVQEALSNLRAGNLPRTSQGVGASYYGRPAAEDFIIPTGWTAQRAFNFMRGTADWQIPYQIQDSDFELSVRYADGFDNEGEMDAPYARHGSELWIRFKAGILHAAAGKP